jgi:hypothetical protein
VVKAWLAILAGGLLLIWPAFLNGYPILFSDSGAFLAQTVEPLMIWDKPWIYGPFAWIFHQHVTLWGTVLAQGLMVSHLIWLLARGAGARSTGAARGGLRGAGAPHRRALVRGDCHARHPDARGRRSARRCWAGDGIG